MRFPNLRAITFTSSLTGILWTPGDSAMQRARFTDFIQTHDAIEQLQLLSTPFYRTSTDNAPGFYANSLPRLRTFSGHPGTFRDMAVARMQSLTTTLLILNIDYDGPTDALEEMFDAILQTGANDMPPLGHLAVLREIHLPIDDRVPFPTLKRMVRQCAECCGRSLEKVVGRLALRDASLDDLVELFASFLQLKMICITLLIFLPTASQEEYRATCVQLAQALADNIPTLSKKSRSRKGGVVIFYGELLGRPNRIQEAAILGRKTLQRKLSISSALGTGSRRACEIATQREHAETHHG